MKAVIKAERQPDQIAAHFALLAVVPEPVPEVLEVLGLGGDV
jgi:hypothetical protein